MKKIFLLISVLLISLSVAFAQSLSTETFSETNMNLPALGSNFDVPVYVADFPAGVNYVIFVLEYDPTVLVYTGYANTQHPTFIPLVNSVPGLLTLTYWGAPFVNEFSVADGKLIDVQFDYLGGDSPLTFGAASRYRKLGDQPVNITDLTDGAVIGGYFDNIIVDGIWENAADWSLSVVPNAFHNVFVQGEAIINSDALSNDLTIEVGGRLSVNIGFSIDVGGDFLIDSDIMGTGSFVNYSAPLSLAATVKQYMTGMTMDMDTTWHLVSVPVDQVWSADVFLNCYLQTWNEPGSAWVDVQVDPDPVYSVIMNTPMLGYAAAYIHAAPGQDKMLEFSGMLNDGPYSIPVINDGVSGNEDWDGWNLVGNPYPSALDVDGPGWTRVNVGDGVAYWDESFDNYRYYADGVPVNDGSRYIPPMQGFFVKASSVGMIGVTNETRAHTNQVFYKSDPANTLRLAVKHGDFTDETVIRFTEEATENYDQQFDFFKLFVYGSPQIYSVTSASQSLAINALPDANENISVNVGLKPGVDAMMSLTASGIGTFNSDLPIWLVDHVAGVYWDLRENPVYNFIANVSDDANRFSIHFKNFTGIPEADQQLVNIYAYDKQLYVDAGSGNKGEIVVLNILGQELVREILNENLNIITLPVSNSYVVVKVISDHGISSRKVFVN